MSPRLQLTIRFLDPAFHGRKGGGESEWPPSPLRVFQALVAAAAARWSERILLSHAKPALDWLASLPAPLIVAASGTAAEKKYRLYVPNNASDLVAGAWTRGNIDASIADHRTEKDVRPTHLAGEAVHYVYPVADAAEFAEYKPILTDAARSVTHLGWGVDMVAGNASELTEEQVAKLEGERWRPTEGGGGTPLRVPRAGTLQDLMDKHTAFLNRLSADGFRPVPPLTAFDTVGYSRDTDLAERQVVAFELRTPDFERFQPYCTERRTPAVAGMVRHAVAALAAQMRPFGWTDEHINCLVHGHTPDGNDRARGPAAEDRFMYLPLPSLEHRGGPKVHVGQLRRVLLVAPPNRPEWASWARVLSGHELTPEEGTAPAALRLIDRPLASLRTDTNLGPYVGDGRVWSTVTPVVLPGYDDTTGIRRRLNAKSPNPPRDANEQQRLLHQLNAQTRDLLLRAFAHSGIGTGLLSDDLLARGAAELDWREVGFRAGVGLARHYRLDGPNYPRYHVRVRFAREVRGPLAVGTGRYRGLGLFAADGD